MNEKTYEEYWTFVQKRDDWYLQCDRYSVTMGELRRKIDALTDAGREIRSRTQDVEHMISDIRALPAKYPAWTGNQADRFYAMCTEEGLHGACDSYHQVLEGIVGSIEAAKTRFSSQLETVNQSYLTARSNYCFWANRVAYYWQ